MKPRIRLGWIVGGWLIALLASALLPWWAVSERIEENRLGLFVDPATGAWTALVCAAIWREKGAHGPRAGWRVVGAFAAAIFLTTAVEAGNTVTASFTSGLRTLVRVTL